MSARFAPVLVFAILLVACGKPSPAAIELRSRASSPADPDLKEVSALVEGDLLVIDAVPIDYDHTELVLCATATSSAPKVVEVLPVRGQCGVFAVAAKSPGHASISFSARESTAVTELDVLPVTP